jgi:hypothetical protein
MVGRWTEGFETHQTATQWARRYATQTGGFAIQAGRVFGSSGSLQGPVFVPPAFPLADVWGVLFGVNFIAQAGALAAGDGFYIEKGGAEQVHLEFVKNATSFEVKLMRGATQLAITTATYAYNAWHHFELKVTVHTSAGTYELRHNEVAAFSATGVNTANAAANQADGFAMRFTNTSTNNRFDDIGVWDGTGSFSNDFIGDCAVKGIEVTGAGAATQWVPAAGSNFDNVDDSGSTTPDDVGAGGFNGSGTVGDQDLYAFSDISPDIQGTVLWVQLDTQLAMAAAGSRNVDTRYRDPSTTVVDIATHTVANTAYTSIADVMSSNPSDGLAWDVADIDGGQFGVQVNT